MKWFKNIILIILSAYSLMLMLTEYMSDQHQASPFDIDLRDITFYNINSSISSVLLWSTALMFSLCIGLLRNRRGRKREYFFFLSQVGIFTYLGFEGSLHSHEGDFIRIFPDLKVALILLGTGLLEGIFLWKYGRISEQKWHVQRPLLIALCLSVITLGFNYFGPGTIILNYSTAVLLKVWTNFFFFLFAWTICMDKIKVLNASTLREIEPLSHYQSSPDKKTPKHKYHHQKPY